MITTRHFVTSRAAVTRLLAALALLLVIAPVAVAAPEAPAVPTVYRIDVEGVIAPATARYILRAIRQAEEARAEALLIRLDTPGGLLKSMDDITKAMLNSAVPIIVYVAPEGARAASAGVFVTYAAHIAVMAPATRIGAAHPVGVGQGGGGGERRRRRGRGAAAARRRPGGPRRRQPAARRRRPQGHDGGGSADAADAPRPRGHRWHGRHRAVPPYALRPQRRLHPTEHRHHRDPGGTLQSGPDPPRRSRRHRPGAGAGLLRHPGGERGGAHG